MTSIASATIASMLSMAITTIIIVTPRSPVRACFLPWFRIIALTFIGHRRVHYDGGRSRIAGSRNEKPDHSVELPAVRVADRHVGAYHLDCSSARCHAADKYVAAVHRQHEATAVRAGCGEGPLPRRGRAYWVGGRGPDAAIINPRVRQIT